MDYSEYTSDREEKIKVAVADVLILVMVGTLFYNSPYSIILAPVLFFPLDRKYRQYKVYERKKALRNQFRDLLSSFSISFSLGQPMKEAMEEGLRQLDSIYGEGSLLARELTSMIRRMEATGERDVDLWNDFAHRCRLEDVESFTAVFSCCRETGGDLPLAINRAASIIGDKIGIENEIRKISAGRRAEAAIIGVMPIGVLLFLRIFAADYVQAVYEGIEGRIIMTTCIAVTVAAAVIGERITSIDI